MELPKVPRVKQYNSKAPKKISLWMYEELIKTKDDEIHLLKNQLDIANNRIDELIKPVETIKEQPIDIPRVSTGVGSKRISPRELARMEAESNRIYWEKEIKRREEEVQGNNNVTEAESLVRS